MKKNVLGTILGVCFIAGVMVLISMGGGAPADTAVSAVPVGMLGYILVPILFIAGLAVLAGVAWVLTAPSRGLKALRGGHQGCRSWSRECPQCRQEEIERKRAQARL